MGNAGFRMPGTAIVAKFMEKSAGQVKLTKRYLEEEMACKPRQVREVIWAYYAIKQLCLKEEHPLS